MFSWNWNSESASLTKNINKNKTFNSWIFFKSELINIWSISGSQNQMLDQCYSDKWTRPKWTEEIIIKKQPSFYLWLSGPGDVQVRPLTRPSTVSVHILASKAQETVHTQVQASFTFLRRQQGDDDDDDVRNCLYRSPSKHNKTVSLWRKNRGSQ